MKIQTKKIILLTGIASLITFGAQANTITPSYVSFSGGTWNYMASLVSGELQPGDGFTIFDFAGYVSGSIVAAPGWSASTATTTSPFGTSLGGETLEMNLTFTYAGAAVLNTDPPSITWFGFSADSASPRGLVDWVSQDHLLGPPPLYVGGGLSPAAQGTTPGPANPVPDGGATVLMLGGALGLLGVARRKLGFAK